MEQFYQLAHAFMNHDLNPLSDPKMAFMICGVLLTFLVLENGFIPTAFLPGDSLLILTGVLIYQDVLSLGVIPLLIMATFVGTWLGYMQGRFLGHTQLYHRLMSHVEERHQQKVYHLLDKYGKGLGATGCVSWSFDRKGVIIIEKEDLDEDTVMMDALDAGADDMQVEEETFEVYTDPDAFGSVLAALEEKGYTFVQAAVEMVPQNYVKLENEDDIKNMEKLIDLLEDNDDVQNVWHNWDQE